MRVEEEVDKADVANSVIVAIGGRKLPVDYDLFETVSGMFERECLLRHLFIVRNHRCRRDINALVAAVDNEINFTSAAVCRAWRSGVTLNMSNIDVIPASCQFVKDDIFHQMGTFALALSDMDVSDACIRRIIFGR